MRISIVASFLAVASATLTLTPKSNSESVLSVLADDNFSASDKWGLFKSHFGKIYASFEQETSAFSAFTHNDAVIREHNAKGTSFTLGHNEFSDMTWDQFREIYVGGMTGNPYLRRQRNFVKLPEATADSVDWVSAGAVTDVKNQGQCGGCWAFSTTGAFEGAYEIATGELVSFSEQQLVSCDKVDDGCSGGLMDNAFGWIKSHGGICTEDSYPYSSSGGTTGTCKQTCSPAATLTGFNDVSPNDEDQLKSAVQSTPVSVAIEADKSVFQLYKSGVFTSSSQCGTQLDHGVLAVGFGVDGGSNYWKVKNSWGSSWGEEGFIRMERDVNCCGISQQPSYPTGVSAVGPGPAPGPAPTPTPSPGPAPTPGQTHYGAPPCMADEEAVQVQGVDGDFCSPPCSNGSCPTDVPDGVSATPSCSLQDQSSGTQYCALQCTENGQCGSGTCQTVESLGGICTY